MPGNSQRKGAVRKTGKGIGAKGITAGSGGRVRRGLEGKGPTPKAEDRPYHKAYQGKQARTGGKRPSSQPRVKRTGRPGAGPEWVVGRNPVLEALNAGLPVKTAFVADGADRDDRLRDIFKFAAEHSLPLLQITRGELDRLTGDAIHQGVALQLPSYDYAVPEDVLEEALQAEHGLLVALDQVTDPRNLGAVIRSAAAFGAQGVIIPERRSAHVTAAVWKTSAGAAARVPVAQAVNLNRLLTSAAKQGFRVIGLAGDAEQSISELQLDDEPILLVVGSEDAGLSRLVRQNCTDVVRIDIASSVESLNASVAAGIALYEVTRARD